MAWDEIAFPPALTEIGEEAFAGDGAITDVLLPDGVRAIRASAFADTGLYTIAVPSSVTYIAPDAFSGVTTPLLIETAPGAEAVRFALAQNLDFRADTVRRALLIGQSAYPEPRALTGPAKDIAAMARLFSRGCEVTVRENLSASDILATIPSVFGKAGDEDISILYYSGHGLKSADPDKSGALMGIDYVEYVTAAQLRAALDAIPGRKIVLIDACYSGGLIGRGASDGALTVSGPARSFLRAFTARAGKPRTNLIGQRYYVMASSLSGEESWENRTGGLFTFALIESKSAGDANDDGVVTFQESHEYTAAAVSRAAEEEGLRQSVQVYPEGCFWFGLFR